MMGYVALGLDVRSQPKVPRVTSRDSTGPMGDPRTGDSLEPGTLWKQVNFFYKCQQYARPWAELCKYSLV